MLVTAFKAGWFEHHDGYLAMCGGTNGPMHKRCRVCSFRGVALTVRKVTNGSSQPSDVVRFGWQADGPGLVVCKTIRGAEAR